MFTNKKSMSIRLVRAKMIINTVLSDPPIFAALQDMGFDEAKLKSGLEMHARAEKLYEEQKREYAEKSTVKDDLYELWEEARAELRKYITAAKLVLPDNQAILNSLGLHRSPHFNLTNWITQARLFYNATLHNPELLEKLKEYVVTEEKLKAGSAAVDKVEELYSKQKVEKTDAKNATRERDRAFEELDTFMYRLYKIARALFIDKPEYFDKFRVMESRVTAKKSNNADKAESSAPGVDGEVVPAAGNETAGAAVSD